VAAGVDEAELRHRLPGEMAALSEVKAGGVLADAWSPGAHAGLGVEVAGVST